MRKIILLGSSVAGLFLLATVALVLAGLNDKLVPADVIVVPGNTIAPDGTPSPRLQARLDVALKQFQEHRAPRILVSGATGKEGFDEAASMARYLQSRGVPANAILEDNQGWTTDATARNAAALMRQHGWRTAMVATQYFHVPRFRLALERSGIAVSGNVHAPYFELRDLYSVPRETVGYLVYYVKS
ncbi:YdcF family protein [Janthinobacterium sp. PLB04]|uniref:YdcF family protein n=1 Tax=Janthinobacterium lividum TaxID=29581 RepID=A0AAJ4T3Z8_9BURK|nr:MULTISPECIES: YdcF family protein [Janthinobacterium]KAB0325838.1 YdcF family protein [Janthinobacterium lividum]QSX94954.1 YdcF family protein [Janthinobacterium lividum]UGQ34771.1 YdcF family protein [Janthinobacterium sp. PLB04]